MSNNGLRGFLDGIIICTYFVFVGAVFITRNAVRHVQSMRGTVVHMFSSSMQNTVSFEHLL